MINPIMNSKFIPKTRKRKSTVHEFSQRASVAEKKQKDGSEKWPWSSVLKA
jgi:hypothetical protein